LWPSLLALLCVAALLAIGVRARRRRACVPGRRALEVIANSLGLSPAERRMIRAIGGAEPAVIMISETAFRAFVERWAQTGPDESQRRDLVKLAGRLGWSGIFVESNRLEVKALPAARRAAAAPTLKLVA
jgi:hypothetical protein